MMVFWTAFCMCVSMFTVLPAPRAAWNDELTPLRTACLPLVGLLIGALWLGIAYLARWLLPHALSSAVIAAVPMALTGCMHIDGFMDTADALMSWRDREEKLRILKDVHAGSFAVILVALALMFQFAACMSADKLFSLLLIPVISRVGSAWCVLRLPALGHSQYAQNEQKRVSKSLSYIVAGVGALALLLMLIFGGWRSLLAGAATAAGYTFAMWRCVKALGGVSGDLAGFSLVIAELCGLIVLAIV